VFFIPSFSPFFSPPFFRQLHRGWTCSWRPRRSQRHVSILSPPPPPLLSLDPGHAKKVISGKLAEGSPFPLSFKLHRASKGRAGPPTQLGPPPSLFQTSSGRRFPAARAGNSLFPFFSSGGALPLAMLSKEKLPIVRLLSFPPPPFVFPLRLRPAIPIGLPFPSLPPFPPPFRWAGHLIEGDGFPPHKTFFFFFCPRRRLPNDNHWGCHPPPSPFPPPLFRQNVISGNWGVHGDWNLSPPFSFPPGTTLA